MTKPAPLRVLFVNGPNLNVLGRREPALYGAQSLAEIRELVEEAAAREDVEVSFFQSNSEGEIVTRIQEARGEVDGLVINPAGYTHTSVAIRDALVYSELPVVEVHLSNPSAREAFRRVSLVEDVVAGRISGFGGYGYVLALLGVLHHLRIDVPD